MDQSPPSGKYPYWKTGSPYGHPVIVPECQKQPGSDTRQLIDRNHPPARIQPLQNGQG
ncbi:hypothetical protein AA18895_1020 [Acetobacter ghanensis DSM 18895]|nr:hypothetical protein AA18895_1020 [Acetobacter ghanensis DSM 18895]